MKRFLDAAIEEAEQSLATNGIPIGSVVVYENEIVSRGHNQRLQKGSSILHAEMDALENLGRKPARYYQKCTLYTTLAPCSMCSGTILLFGIPTVVIGENENFAGEPTWLKERGVELTVLNDPRCIELMASFISENPELWHEDIGELA